MGLPNVFLVSDSSCRREQVLRLLRNRHWRIVPITEGDQLAVAVETHGSPRLLVLHGNENFCTPFLNFLGDLRNRSLSPPFLVLAVGGSEAFAVAALRAGAADYFSDAAEDREVACAISRWTPENAPPGQDLEGGEVLVGNSLAMQSLRAYIHRLAGTSCNVLITGETGTGKELVAQLIHQNSPRSRHPLVSINCAAIPDSLLESELFGYERGAFTGANSANPGKLMAADKGTVFFDEIGDMSPVAQAKVLRAIEAKEVQRLGSNRRYETDIRILAATHHELDAMTTSGSFRRDLYFRLNVGRIHLPPLRERKADLAGLIRHVIADLNRKMARHIDGVSGAALVLLTQYDWPGNVRELRNVIERIFITRESGQITAEDLPSSFQQQLLAAPLNEDHELSCLREALVICNGNKSKAAEKLNWSRMTLYRKLAKYKLLEGSSNRWLPSSRSLDDLGASQI